jgi:hypothetical protein
MGKFFLLSILVLGSATFAWADSASATAALNPNASTHAQPSADDGQRLTRSTRTPVNKDVAPDHVCLNIHAFIFETNDDRVPKLVGETTCMTVNGSMKRVGGPSAPRLMPATDGNKF